VVLDAVMSEDPIDVAWRIHAAIADWTGKVDSKASFALAIESAVMVGIINMTSDGRRLADIGGWFGLMIFWLGVSLLIAGILTVVTVVRPRLRRDKIADEWKDNFVYFGHLRRWKPEDLAVALEERELLPVLSRQLVHMSDIAWTKHRRLQTSMTLVVIGTVLVGVAAAVNG